MVPVNVPLNVAHIQLLNRGVALQSETNLVTAWQDCNLGKSDIVLSKSLIEQIKGNG